jgi:endonuclease/exonuclease/phosphatase family metal-dependent hydrolase
MASVRVASFNAHWCLDRRGGDVDLVAVTSALDADVLCLQEAWRRRDRHADHEIVARKLGYELVEARVPRAHNDTAPAAVRAVDGSRSWWGLALLSRYPIGEVREYELGRVIADEADRIAVRARLDVDGTPFTVVFTHLTWRAWGIPMQLWRLRRDVLADVVDAPAAVMGDFNMWGPVVTSALPGWRRTARGRTWPAPRVRHQLDHILVTRAVRVRETGIEPYNGSDHLPVRADLVF